MRKAMVATFVLVLGLALQAPRPASGEVASVDSGRLREAVTVNGILQHERHLQAIANRNGGTRASGTPGFAASATYVADRLRAAGYQVSLQEFTFPFFRELAPAELAAVSPTAKTYDALSLYYSGSGDVTGRLVPTKDIVIPPSAEPSSTSGCESGDYRPAPSTPAVALVQRGTCTFQTKVDHAIAAGYDAVVIFNEGQPGRDELLQGSLDLATPVPVVGTSFPTGAALYQAAGDGAVEVRVSTSTENIPKATTTNVIADSPRGVRDETVVVGAHLDSVPEGPGINDNGSGVATNLEIAEQLAALGYLDHLQRPVRFAFWAAEEEGLLGSTHYVESLTDSQLDDIYANLNFDMLGSPNYVRFVYDGDGSSTDEAGPVGSREIERVFTDYFTGAGLPIQPTAFDGRSDYEAFKGVGIPAGGLDSGAEGIKTEAEAKTYGGTAGQPYDVCYHQACDTVANLSSQALHELGDAAAHGVLALATSPTGLFPDRSGASRVAPRAVAHSQGPSRAATR